MKNKPGSIDLPIAKAQKDAASTSLIKNWSTTEPIGPYFSSCITNHEIWYCSARGLYGIDQFTGLQQHSFVTFGNQEGTLVQYVQPFEKGILVACSDAAFYYIDLSANVPAPVKVAALKAGDIVQWMEARYGSVYACSTHNGLMVLQTNAENQISLTGGVEKGTAPYPILGPQGIYWAKGKQLNIYDPVTLHKQHSLKLSGDGAPDIRSACEGQIVCVVTNKDKPYKTISASSAGDKPKVLWTTSLKVSVNDDSALLTDEQYCYVPLVNGSVMVLDIITGKQAAYNGKQVGPFELGGTIYRWVLQQDGILYAAVEKRNKTANICVINLKTGVVLEMKTGLSPVLLAIDNGVLYYVDQSTDQYGDLFYAIHSVRLSTLVREFYAETILMQEMEFPGQKKGAPSKKARVVTEITLFDESGSPRLLQHVRIGATGTGILQWQGADYPVGPSTYADLTTDANGRIRLGMKAGYTDSKGKFHEGLTCPGLTLFTTFMDNDLSILIRPEAQLHDVLAGVTGNTLVNGKDFNGKPVIKSDYRKNSQAMTDVAKAISTTAVMVKQSVEHKNKLLSATGKRYLADGCNMDTICCCADGNYHCPVRCTNNYSFDLGNSTKRNSSPAFADQLTDAQVQQWLNAHPLTTDPLPMSWGDFWDAVKSGAAAISDAIVYAAKKVQARISAIIDGLEHTIDLVIDTLEKAILVAQGIFNTIAEGISKVIEMFSFLFDWQDILKTKNLLKGQVNSALDKLLKPDAKSKKSLFDEMKAKGDGLFTGLKSKVNDAFNSLEGKIGNYSGQSTQNEMTKNSRMANPAQGGANANWLQAKLTDHVISRQAIEVQAMTLNGSGSLSGTMFPEFKLPDELADELQKLLKKLQEEIKGDALQTLNQIQATISGDINSLFGATMDFFINILKGVVDIGIDMAKAFFDVFMILVKGMMTALKDYINYSIDNIPFVSALYRYITSTPQNKDGDALTILDLVCLLVAIPTQLIVKLIPASKTAAIPPALPAILSIASGAGQVIWGSISGLLNLLNISLSKAAEGSEAIKERIRKVQIFVAGGIGGVVRTMLLAAEVITNYKTRDDLIYNTIFWFLPTVSVACDVIILSYYSYKGIPLSDGVQLTMAGINFFLGLMGLALVGIIIVICHKTKHEINLMSILFTALGLFAVMCRPLMLLVNPVYKGAAVVIISGFVLAAGGIKITAGVCPKCVK